MQSKAVHFKLKTCGCTAHFRGDRCIAFVIRLFMVKTLTAVRIKERDLKALEELAVQEDETVSSLIRQAIREFLDRRRNDPDKG